MKVTRIYMNIQSISLINIQFLLKKRISNYCSCHFRHNTFRSFVKKRRISLVLICFLVVFFSRWNLNFSHADNLPNEHCVHKYYRSIQVRPGDSMELIVRDHLHTLDPNQVQNYIAEICLINHKVSPHLQAGEYLIVPYYSCHLFATAQ